MPYSDWLALIKDLKKKKQKKNSFESNRVLWY